MKKFIAILTVSGLVFAATVNVPAAPDDRGGGNKKKAPQKTKTVAAKPQTGPKQKSAGPKTVNTNVSKNQVNKTSNVQANKVKPSNQTQLKTNTNGVTKNANVNKNNVNVNKNNVNVNKNNVNINKNNVNVNKVAVNRESVARIQAQHTNFRAVPNTAITSVRYNQNYRIANANNWVGPRYEVFRTYQPQWHDSGYWGSHYARVSLIAGGWYYFNNGYWAPAWGYNEAESYYPYDGPIYAGPSGRPADQVVADVQGVLKEQGYYHGEVDGLVGPQTREALTAYQEATGLSPTASIDEPTLESLGLS